MGVGLRGVGYSLDGRKCDGGAEGIYRLVFLNRVEELGRWGVVSVLFVGDEIISVERVKISLSLHRFQLFVCSHEMCH